MSGAAGTVPEGTWTPRQREAITARGTDVLVSAAAGAGKTSVLVARALARVLDPDDPVDVDRLLVVTFTEAAAGEMRARMAARFEERMLATDPAGPEGEELRRQLTLLPRASISTIHAFCLQVVRQHAYRLGIDPGVAILDPQEADLTRAEALDRLLSRRHRRALSEPGSPFGVLVDAYGGARTDEDLRRWVLRLHDFARSLPDPGAWLARALAAFDPAADPAAGEALEDQPTWEAFRRGVEIALAQARSSLGTALELCRQPGGPAGYAALLEAEAGAVAAALEAAGPGTTWDTIAGAVAAVSFGRLPGAKDVDPDLKDRARAARDRAKKRLKALADDTFSRPASALLAELRDLALPMGALVDLVLDLGREYRVAKRRRGVLDFQDLERFAFRLLGEHGGGDTEGRDTEGEDATDRTGAHPAGGPPRPSAIALALRERFAEVLVDEYQDTNALQDSILALVSRDGTTAAADGAIAPRNRFLVGDVKQSIYGFRHTDLGLFQEKYEAFREGPGPDGAAGRRIVLGENFRSRPAVIHAVNALFRRVLTPELGGLAYGPDVELIPGARFPPDPDATATPADGPPVEVHLLERAVGGGAGPGDRDGDSDELGAWLEETDAAQREATVVAARVRTLLEGDPVSGEPPARVWDARAGVHRQLAPRDVAVLLRATRNRANEVLRALAAEGIAGHAELATGYFGQLEVETMVALLQLLDNPHQDLPLAAVLRSPILDLSTAELARVRLLAPRADLLEAVRVATSASALPVPTRERLTALLASLERWRSEARRGPLSRLLWRIYTETGFLAIAGALPGGAQRRANLLALHDRARQFDHFARQGLFRFLRFVERLREDGGDLGAAPAVGADEDVVRVMSIHRAKGLEFPVVFVTDLGRTFNDDDARGDLVFHRDLGLGPRVVDVTRGVKHPSFAHGAIAARSRLDSRAEELRILYVALTRARERLVLVGSTRGLAERAGRWRQDAGEPDRPLAAPVLAGARSALDWIGPALWRHPDAGPLRASPDDGGEAEDGDDPTATGTGPGTGDDPSRWIFHVWSPSELELAGRRRPDRRESPAVDWQALATGTPAPGGDGGLDAAALAGLGERLRWSYPHAAATRHFAKLSVSELKGRAEVDRTAAEESARSPGGPGTNAPAPSLPRRPRFLTGEPGPPVLDPAEVGTATHLLLQHLDLAAALDAADVREQAAALVARALLSPVEASAVDAEAVADFFASDLGVRVREGRERVRRELPFTLGLPAGEVHAGLDDDTAVEPVLVQGVIDLLLLPEPGGDGGAMLLDFKTGAPRPEAYRAQMELYRRAVEEILGHAVSETFLFFLATREAVRL